MHNVGNLYFLRKDNVMNDPKAEIIGVYTVPQENKVKLIELSIDCPPVQVDIEQLRQQAGINGWQIAYYEHYLNKNGTELIGDCFNVPTSIEYTRLAVYLYNLKFDKPLSSQFGELKLLTESPMPDRLKNIIEEYDSEKINNKITVKLKMKYGSKECAE